MYRMACMELCMHICMHVRMLAGSTSGSSGYALRRLWRGGATRVHACAPMCMDAYTYACGCIHHSVSDVWTCPACMRVCIHAYTHAIASMSGNSLRHLMHVYMHAGMRACVHAHMRACMLSQVCLAAACGTSSTACSSSE